MILNIKLRKFTVSTLSSICLLTCLSLCFSLWASSNANAKTLLVYGDSLSAAYGMDQEKGWVSLLAQSLASTHTIKNASISGETSAGGLARLPLTLKEISPDLVILELGANDGLRGYSTKLMQQNLHKMINAIKESGASVILASIGLPAAYGPRYIDEFRSVYADLALQHDIPLLDLFQPSFLETPGYIQEDGLHPTEITQPIIRDLVANFLEEHNPLED